MRVRVVVYEGVDGVLTRARADFLVLCMYNMCMYVRATDLRYG